ncbi:hypothetical protein [Streptodolium elevatio]|uniref:Uncharacterized protein n=1 Tax=Streptodolium elevatio TaxID=3157996 RepID=A0ABV3DC00_9ACTN
MTRPLDEAILQAQFFGCTPCGDVFSVEVATGWVTQEYEFGVYHGESLGALVGDFADGEGCFTCGGPFEVYEAMPEFPSAATGEQT